MRNKGLLLLLSLVIVHCNPKNKGEDAVRAELDSLKSTMEKNKEWVTTLHELGVLMDSIDSRRNLLRVNMIEGTVYSDYVLRMKSIQKYISESQQKIEELENMLKKSGNMSNAFSAITNRFKADLKMRQEAMAALQEKVERYKKENLSLIKEVSLKKIEINDKEKIIRKKKQELNQIKEEIQKLILQNRTVEGNAYYARGEAIEETARRTKLAPRKKRQTYKEALLMYKKAFSLGITKASKKIKQLEKE